MYRDCWAHYPANRHFRWNYFIQWRDQRFMNTKEHSTYVSVPPGEGVRVDKAVTIERPIGEVYNFWRHLENFPRFMRHVKEVTRQDDTHSHWAVRTVGGKVMEWDAEIIEQRENELISWRSI